MTLLLILTNRKLINQIMKKEIVFVSVLLLISGLLKAQNLSEKANVFLKTLSSELRVQTIFSLNDEERFNMNFVPLERKGPTFNEFNDKQTKAALGLLRASLSQEGYRKATDIMELERVLAIIENNKFKMPDGRPARDPLNYHFCIFGQPSPTDAWGWRFEGHHVSLNFVSSKGEIVASTPSFYGSNPSIVSIKG